MSVSRISYCIARRRQLAFLRILFRRNRFSVEFSKIVNVDVRTRFRGYSNKVELPISDHSQIKDHVYTWYMPLFGIFMIQWHIVTLFHSNISQDVVR